MLVRETCTKPFKVQLTQMDTQIVERKAARGHYSLCNPAKVSGRLRTSIYLHPKGPTDFGNDILERNRVFQEINGEINYFSRS